MNYFFLVLMLMPIAAFAQQSPGEPVEITAKQTLEWHRNDNQFIARGDVIAKQGTASVYSDMLTADYRETPTASMDIYKLTASGAVRLDNNDGSIAYGDQALYDVETATVTLTGNNLRLDSPERTITATDRLEYLTSAAEARAIGNAKMVQGDDTISANTLKAFFTEGANGTRTLSRAEGNGNVVIITPEEKLTGNNGIYNAANNTAEITGNVRITRGPNVLEGARASVNLATNVSTLYGGESSPTGDTRVRGVFYPEKKDTP